MSNAHRGPLLYSLPGGIADGIPLDFADRSFNRKIMGASIGNGVYGGPPLGATATTGGFVLTENVSSPAAVAVLNSLGRAVLTTGATTQSSENLQFLQLPFRRVVGKRMVVFARLALNTVANGQFYFGLFESQSQIINTNALAGARDHMGFVKLGAPTDITFAVATNATGALGSAGETIQAMGLVLTDGAFFVVGFVVDAAGRIQAYAALDPNDVFRTNPASLLGAGKVIAVTNAPTVDTFLSVVSGTNTAGARALTVDWAVVSVEHA